MENRPSNLEAHMRRATEAVARGTGSQAELEAAARALVRELRSANAPPEQMLLRIKEILAEAGLRPAYASTDATTPPRGESAIYRAVIEWSIRQYYDDRERTTLNDD
ncbi:MAG TPA: hypothetical protein VHV78_10525 [Gemmatimonadaceae bacterium]|jgi:hypothetical protein|nr:hypothetical protein [Gemmatimonadaceae bacterium]